MLALQIAALVPVRAVILLSSIAQRAENPLGFRVLAPLQLHRVVSVRLMTSSVRWWGPYYGYPRGEAQTLFCSMVSRQTDALLRWSVGALARWREPSTHTPPDCLAPVYRIHGSADRTFPLRRLRGRDRITVIDRGGHLMAHNRSAEVNAAIRKILEAVRNS